ncbi:MAG: hypothetical protein ABIS92_02025 [Polyangia bacterium]
MRLSVSLPPIFRQIAGDGGSWRTVTARKSAGLVAGVAPGAAGTNRAIHLAVLNRLCNLVRPLGLLCLSGLLAAGASCAHPNFYPGTSILRTDETQKIVDTIDQYRVRLAERNVEGLLVMASQKYREDSGTPRSDDDYGYEGLRQVLRTRLTRLKSIWYEIEMRDIRLRGPQADVDVFLNGSFEMAARSGDRYRRVNDYHRFVLEKEGDRWKFVSGM